MVLKSRDLCSTLDSNLTLNQLRLVVGLPDSVASLDPDYMIARNDQHKDFDSLTGALGVPFVAVAGISFSHKE